MIWTNSGLREAPPTRKPSTSPSLASSLQFLAFTEPVQILTKIKHLSNQAISSSAQNTHTPYSPTFLRFRVRTFHFKSKQFRSIKKKVSFQLTVLTYFIDSSWDRNTVANIKPNVVRANIKRTAAHGKRVFRVGHLWGPTSIHIDAGPQRCSPTRKTRRFDQKRLLTI